MIKMGSQLLDDQWVNLVLKEFNPEIYNIEPCISRESYIAHCSSFEDILYEEKYSNEMIYRIEELQWKIKCIEEILNEEENEGL